MTNSTRRLRLCQKSAPTEKSLTRLLREMNAELVDESNADENGDCAYDQIAICNAKPAYDTR